MWKNKFRNITMNTTNLEKVKKERQVLKHYNGYDKSR